MSAGERMGAQVGDQSRSSGRAAAGKSAGGLCGGAGCRKRRPLAQPLPSHRASMQLLRKQLRSVVTNVDWPALRTDVATAGGLGCAGDFICQTAVEGQSSMNWRRFAAVSAFEAAYMGGLFHFLCQIFPLVVCAVGRQMPARYGLARSLQATGSAAHAFGCAIVVVTQLY